MEDGSYAIKSSTWYLHLDKTPQEWTRGPDLSQGRYALTCSFIAQPFRQIVIVVGVEWSGVGVGTEYPETDMVDILDLETNLITPGK